MVDQDGPEMEAGGEPQGVPGLRGGNRLTQIVAARGHHEARRPTRPRRKQEGGGEERRRTQPAHMEARRHTACGSTIIRPAISIWRAWQNHWQ